MAVRDGADAERLGSVARVTAERHGAIRVGTPRELAQVARVFGALGMHPVGFYDLREAAAGAVPSCRPRSAPSTARSWHVTRSASSPPCSPPPTRGSSTRTCAPGWRLSWPAVSCSPGAARPRRPRGGRGGTSRRRRRRVSPPCQAASSCHRPGRPGLVRPLEGLRRRRGHRGRPQHPYQPPHSARPGHRRALGAMTERGIEMIDTIQGPPALEGPRRPAAADLLPCARRAPRAAHPAVGAQRRPAGALRRGRGARYRPHAARAARATTGCSPRSTSRRRPRRRPGGVAAAPAGDRTRAGGAGAGARHVPGRGPTAVAPGRARDVLKATFKAPDVLDGLS